MTRFVATFHTHLSAILTRKALQRAGITATLTPVPRKLSSSCGSCVFYEAEDPFYACMDEDTEAVYRVDGEDYVLCRIISE